MPIFARTKMVLEDDCFPVTAPLLTLKYSGPDPHLAYDKIRELFRTVFAVKEEERVQEKEFSWERDGKKDTFNVIWEVVKDMDRFSYLKFVVTLKGYAEQTKGGKEGKVTVQIGGVSRTEYAQDSIWERSIFYEIGRVIWHRVFYHDKREEFQAKCRSLMNAFQSELKSFFNLLPKRV